MIHDIVQAIESSDVESASAGFHKAMKAGTSPWEVHRALFPAVQRVLNPPFINPHLPKMYGINGEFLPYLREEDLPSLVRLEIMEYARRPKLGQIPRPGSLPSSVSFGDIQAAIREKDRQKAAVLMAAFCEQKEKKELARKVLMLGSGYLDGSLGHSVSCTAFILLQMLARADQDPWPALSCLSDYFCKGGFHTEPHLETKIGPLSPEAFDRHLLAAASGKGIVNLHHTITRYAIERVRHLLDDREYAHMIGRWVDFLQGKEAHPFPREALPSAEVEDYPGFFDIFSKKRAKPVVSAGSAMWDTAEGRNNLGRFLVKGVCDLYQGDYNPHYITGLGSSLWVMERYGHHPEIAATALFQFTEFFFDGIRE